MVKVIVPLLTVVFLLALSSSVSAQNVINPINATLQDAAVANGNGQILHVSGMGTAALTVSCSGCSGGTTINFEGTQDEKNWSPVLGVESGTSTTSSTVTTAGVTVWQISVSGLNDIRARISSYSAGTVMVTATAVAVAMGAGGSSGSSPAVTLLTVGTNLATINANLATQ